MATTEYQVRDGFYLHKKEGKVNRVYQAGELVDLTEAEAEKYAHQIQTPRVVAPTPKKSTTKEAAA